MRAAGTALLTPAISVNALAAAVGNVLGAVVNKSE